MATFETFLAAKWKEQVARNHAECVEAARTRDPDLIKKIQNQMQRLLPAGGDTVDSVLARIQTDSYLRSYLIKDPSKQGIHETAQAEWIRLCEVADLTTLPKASALCLNNHGLCPGKNRPATATKTLDTYSAARNEYGILKYTGADGGAQDNQYRDVKHFMLEIVGYLTKNPGAGERFVFYLDGAYYTAARRDALEIPGALRDRIRVVSAASLLPPATA
jgi:hypothetical protein